MWCFIDPRGGIVYSSRGSSKCTVSYTQQCIQCWVDDCRFFGFGNLALGMAARILFSWLYFIRIGTGWKKTRFKSGVGRNLQHFDATLTSNQVNGLSLISTLPLFVRLFFFVCNSVLWVQSPVRSPPSISLIFPLMSSGSSSTLCDLQSFLMELMWSIAAVS